MVSFTEKTLATLIEVASFIADEQIYLGTYVI
jgi:hypothetical protein